MYPSASQPSSTESAAGNPLLESGFRLSRAPFGQIAWSSRLHFGLGPHDRVDRIEVRWIDGRVDVLENVHVDQLLLITKGTHRQS